MHEPFPSGPAMLVLLKDWQIRGLAKLARYGRKLRTATDPVKVVKTLTTKTGTVPVLPHSAVALPPVVRIRLFVAWHLRSITPVNERSRNGTTPDAEGNWSHGEPF